MFLEINFMILVNVSFLLIENYMVIWKYKEKNLDFVENINIRNLVIKYVGGSFG